MPSMNIRLPRRLAVPVPRRDNCCAFAQPEDQSQPSVATPVAVAAYADGDFGASGCCIDTGRHLNELLAADEATLSRLRWRHPNRSTPEAILKGLI